MTRQKLTEDDKSVLHGTEIEQQRDNDFVNYHKFPSNHGVLLVN